MTTLDRAFIKAYQETEGSAPTLPMARDRQPAIASAMAAKLEPRAPHILATAAIAAHESHAAKSFAPLSAFSPAARIDDTFRPLLEVDRLQWPSACDELLSAARAGWEALAERLGEMTADGRKFVSIASTKRGAGRTTIALSIAKLMAARGVRPVVVDADFDNPQLASSCGISPEVGWGEVITSELALGEALITALDEGVTLMPWHGPGGRLADKHAADRASECFRLLEQHFDLIIIDSPALSGPKAIGEMTAVVRATGGCPVYLVRDSRSPNDAAWRDSCAPLQAASLDVVGSIENFSRHAPSLA